MIFDLRRGYSAQHQEEKQGRFMLWWDMHDRARHGDRDARVWLMMIDLMAGMDDLIDHLGRGES